MYNLPMAKFPFDSRQLNLCSNLEEISLEHEKLNKIFKEQWRTLNENYLQNLVELDLTSCSSSEATKETVNYIIAKKADELKSLLQSSSSSSSSSIEATSNVVNLMELMENCENKCHEILTHLANFNWQLNEFRSLTGKLNEAWEVTITEYNAELSLLYRRRRKKLLLINEFHNENKNKNNNNNNNNNNSNSNNNNNNNNEDDEDEDDNDNNDSLDYNFGESSRFSGTSHENFWLIVLKVVFNETSENKRFYLDQLDQNIIRYLTDIQYYLDYERINHSNEYSNQDSSSAPNDLLSHTILFYFNENPYFTNKILSKTILISDNNIDNQALLLNPFHLAAQQAPLGAENVSGCDINWRSQEGSAIYSNVGSFLNFFSPLTSRQPEVAGRFQDLGYDYSLFEMFRDLIIPNAISLYMAFMRTQEMR